MLISKIPSIISAREQKIDYKTIKDILLDKFEISTTETRIRRLIYSYHNDTLKTKFKNLRVVIMSAQDILLNNEIMRYLIKFNNVSDLTFVIKRDLEISEAHQVTLDKIKLLSNPVDRIYAKWFTRMFNIADNELVDFETCSQEQVTEIEKIPLIIDELYKDITSKILNRIMEN